MKRIVFLNIALLVYAFAFSCSNEPQIGDECREDAHLCVNGTFYYCGQYSQITYSKSCSSICQEYRGYDSPGSWTFEGHCSVDSDYHGSFGCCVCFNEELGFTECITANSEGNVR